MELPHITINIPDTFSDLVIEKITSDIKSERLNLKVNKVPNEPMMAIELTIPALIAIFIAQSYFGGFLSELGKDHFLTLKKWLKKTAIDSRKINVVTLAASKSTEKINKSNTQSKAFSLHLKTKDNRHIKLLFDLNLKDEIWEKAIDNMIDLIHDNYRNYPDDELTMKVAELNTYRPNIYAIINPDTEKWEYFDHMMLFIRQKDIKKMVKHLAETLTVQ